MSHLIDHFCTITHHRLLVMKYCFRIGLYRQGLMHDLSKYSPTEFIPGVIYFQGTRSPNDAERRDKGYSSAWMHHKGRNKHHLEYWTDYKIGTKTGTMAGVRMPLRYVLEMFCDRIAASRVYNRDTYTDEMPYQYFMRGRSFTTIHPETGAFLEKLLRLLARYGEERTFRFLRWYWRTHRDY